LMLCIFSVLPATGLVDHDPIVINSDTGFTAGGYPGLGTVDDPYRIEGYRIVTDALHRNGVEIRGTSAYFVVRGCVIEADYIGVLVENTAPDTGSIVDNVVSGRTGDGGGISLGADGVVVVNNTCWGFTVGVHTNYADGCVFQYNNFSYNAYQGMGLRYSNDCVITRNTVVGNGAHGIFIIRGSTGNRVYNNTVSGNSAIKSYQWDDIYSFTVASQGCDEGRGNTWYDESTKTGNMWSDYDGVGSYLIDGSAGAVDKYPITGGGQTVEPSEALSGGIPGFGFVSLLVGALVWLMYRGCNRFR
jgi:parallel beta-helix repeat protein